MESLSKIILLFFLFCCHFKINMAEENSLITVLEGKFQEKMSELSIYVVKWLEDFNDRHLGDSALGRLLHYEDFKPKFSVETSRKGRMKKMGMALLPLIFHVGATSTWMILTSIMAAKSVAIGLALLVFKIAVSSAKVGSFFTALKAKSSHHHEYSWPPPSEHHGFDRSLPGHGSYYPADWNSYTPEVHEVSPPYKTIPTYKHHEPTFEDVEYAEDSKPHS